MSIFHALILGIVEGLTEFLPISSTAHLIITSNILGIKQTEFTKFFEVFIQSGAILAVVLLYGNYILTHKKYIKLLIVSFVPTGMVGFMFHKIIKNTFFESIPLIITAIFIIGIVFLILEYLIKKNKIQLHKNINEITLQQAFVIGLFQSLAVIPGVSRAGSVMIVMMGLGFNRSEAALFSFLLAIPTILAASIFDLLKSDPHIVFNTSNLPILVVGFVSAFLTAIMVIKWFIGYLQNHTLVSFGIYRMLLSVLLIVF